MKLPSGRDNLLFLLPVLILATGLFFIYSASWREGAPLDQSLVLRQSLWMLMAVALTLFSLRIHYRHLVDAAWPLYFLTILLLVVVLFAPARLGARRWLPLGFFNFQPSELAKLAVILVLGAFLKENRVEHIRGAKRWVPVAVTVLPLLLIAKEPDLGTALLFVPVLFCMLYVWGLRLRWILLFFLAAGILSPMVFGHLHDYQKARLAIFLNPDSDPLGAGYTIIQSKIAIGSGGFFGKGFRSGTQTQLEFLPEKHTDFIFSVIGEEGGFAASLFVVVCYWLIVYRGFRIAASCGNRFGQLVATGISSLLAFQAIINMAMTTGLLPVVGMPLLLVSYGGSSLLGTMFLIGILINIGMRREPFL